MTWSGCSGFGSPRARRGEQTVEHVERGGDIAAVDRVREIEATGRADVAEVHLDIVDAERDAAAVRGLQHLHQLGDSPRVLTQVLDEPRGRVRREPHPRVLELRGEHARGLLGRRRDDRRVCLGRLVDRRRRPAATRHEYQARLLRTGCDPPGQPLRLIRRQVPDVAHHHHAIGGHERWALQRVGDRRECRQVDRCAVAFGFGRRVLVARASPPRRDRVVLERQRPILGAEQLVDEPLHLAIAQAGIGTLDEVGRHAGVTT